MPTRLTALVLLGALTAGAAGSVVPQGPVPSSLPPRLLVGLREEGGPGRKRASGVPWDLRYRVLAKGWADAGPSGTPPGSAALQFMRESRDARLLPALVFAQLNGEPQGGPSAFYAKTQNATTMHGYFSDFRLLMRRAREFGGPVLVIVEPNGAGLLQEQTHGNPQAFAAIAATGLEELARLPDTVAGWGLAFLRLREAVGARNVVLALGVSSWAGGRDVLYEAVDAALQPEVESVVRFLRPLGLASNALGVTYELVASDPLDRDTDFFRTERRAKFSWDPSDEASTESRSFNRYAEWLQRFNQRSGRRWVLWQIPPGRVTPPKDAPRRAALTARGNLYVEYFFGEGGEAHRRRVAEAGVLALLFGGEQAATPEPAARTEDLAALEERVRRVLQGGPLPLPGSDAARPPASGSEAREASASGAARPRAGTGGSGLPSAQVAVPPLRTAEEARGPGRAAPQLSVALTAGASRIATGAVSTLSATVRNAGTAVEGVDVSLEVKDATGASVTRQAWTGQRLGAGQSATFAWPWVAPARPGPYRAQVRLAGAGRTPLVQSAPLALTVLPPAQTPPGPAATPGPTSPAPPAPPAQYDFERGVEGWTTRGAAASAPFPSGAQAFAGTRSLGVGFTGRPGTASVFVPAPPVGGGRRVRFAVWLPAGSALGSVQAFVQEGPEAAWRYTGAFRSAQQLVPGAWNTLELAVPQGARSPLLELGVEFRTRGGWRGTAYIDAVRW